MPEPTVIYRDACLLAIDKPAGLPSQATPDPGRDHAVAWVERYLRHETEVTNPYVALHHRLDRDTTGVLLFATHRDANVGLSRAFSEHLAQKTYLAIVELPGAATPVSDEWTIDNFLAVKKVARSGSRTEAVRSGGDRAITHFRILQRLPRVLVIEALPRTGRTHQIRAHLSQSGLPIIGDKLYGAGRGPWAERVLLHASRLELPHPVDGSSLVLESAIPEDMQRFLS
jgi:23S rRNA pseudouridine955/2504/2580 synthase